MRKEYLTQAWLILALALCMGAGLAAVEMTLKPKIEENKRNEMLSQVPELIPGAVKGELDEPLREVYGKPVARALDAEGNTVGWAIQASGPGYGGTVTVLVALDKDLSRIHGIYILEQKETPNLGNKIIEPAFRDKFAGKGTIEPLAVTKTAAKTSNQIEAITGATISSTAVVNIVNDGVENFRKALFEQAPQAHAETPETGDSDAQ
jgi:electron transport complex protein RnfG